MSRSYRKVPIIGVAGKSDSWYKRLHSKQERALVRQLLAHGLYEMLPFVQKRYDDWSSNKDGKMMFDPIKYPRLMRK